jgi:MinD superfamily P-loop ATPase
VSFRSNRVGAWSVREIPWGRLVHATLGVAQDSSGKLVAHLRREGRELAAREGADLILIDGPPGIGCPVHAAITGADAVVVVTEPTEAGIHDLTRALYLTDHFGLRTGIVLNKADLNLAGARVVETVASFRQVPILGSIPFDARLPRLLARQETGLEIRGVRQSIVACWMALERMLGDGTPLTRGQANATEVGPRVER